MNIVILILLLLLLWIFFVMDKPQRMTLVEEYFIKNYSRFKLDSLGGWTLTPGGIPKIIIKTSWQNIDKMPKQMIDALNKTKTTSPDYQLYYFDNTDVIEFMKDYSPRAFAAYNKIIPGAFKADLFRVCILEKYGGCYSDIGHTPLVSFNEINGLANVVLVKDCPVQQDTGNCDYYGIHNALMCSIKNHGFFKLLVDKTCENIENNYYGNGPLDVTGPVMIGKQFNCYFADICDYINKNFVNPGNFIYHDTNVKILNYAFKYKILDGNRLILSTDGKIIIDTKFKDYYEIMYRSNKTPSYTELWNIKKIYN